MEIYRNFSWLVSEEQAEKLKGIGFDVPCVYFYNKAYKEKFDKLCLNTIDDDINIGRVDYKNITFITTSLHIHELDNNKRDLYVSAPTFEQVFEWFRKKGFRISLENHEDSTKFMFYNMKIKEGKHFKGEFSNYEKAREALINKLIEVYGNK